MPVLDDDDMESHKIGGTSFQYSAVKISSLGATEYTIFGLAVDRSGSVSGFAGEIEACMKSVIESCQKSPRADNLLTRVTLFNHGIQELHGFKELANCHPADYANKVAPGGGTALYDACATMVDAVASYGKTLIKQDYSCNGIVVVITDGVDNGDSTLSAKAVKEALENAIRSESLESLVSILIGVNVTNVGISNKLKEFNAEVGFSQYIETKDANPATLAKVAGFISKSVSSQSQSLGTKAPSQPITF